MSESTKTPSAAGPIDAHVGARIRLRRMLLRMSQEKLGAALGLTFQQVQKYERGTNKVGASRLYEMSKILRVPIGFFFDDMQGKVEQSASLGYSSGFRETSAGFRAFASADSVKTNEDLHILAKRETLELMRAYYRIPDAEVRKRVMDLIKTLSEQAAAAE